MRKSSATSAPNIALIKYWGNRNDEWRLPAADSLSMTLDCPRVEVHLEESDVFSVISFDEEKKMHVLDENNARRFQKQIDLSNFYLEKMGAPLLPTLAISIHSDVPRGIGLASSAALFSALAMAESAFIDFPLPKEQISILARIGSGSASRSIFGGFSALLAGDNDDIESSFAVPLFPHDHWNLTDIVIAPSLETKKTGSSEGHALAATSPLFKDRIATLPQRQKECIAALTEKDFEKLQHVAEEDALNMHRVMETSTPPLRYLTEETHRIVNDMKTIRSEKHLPVLFTMDAGPTVHLICEKEARDAVFEFAHSQQGCRIFEANVGADARLIPVE